MSVGFRSLLGVACYLALVTVVGCSAAPSSTAPDTGQVDKAAADLLPDSIKQAKVLNAESVSEFPPFESVGQDGQVATGRRQ